MIQCALCDAHVDDLGYVTLPWRTVNPVRGGRPAHVCPAHWPPIGDSRAWHGAYDRVFEQLAAIPEFAAAKEIPNENRRLDLAMPRVRPRLPKEVHRTPKAELPSLWMPVR